MFKIGSFNCLNLGMAASKDIQTFADIILDGGFDIIALQEIKGHNGLNRIMARLPSYWEGDADDSVNDYAFIWNTRRFVLANAEETGLSREYKPRIYKQYKIDRKNGQTDLIREPFFARFFPTGGAAPYIEVRIINTHIRFSKGKSDNSEDVNTPGAIAMRKNEFDVLTKAIYAKEADKRYGNNRPSYTILLGDYNLNSPSSTAKSPYLIESFEIDDTIRSKKIITTIQKELSTLKKKQEDDSQDVDDNNIFANNYDHFTYDASSFRDVVVTCQRINTVDKYCDGDKEKHIKDISDHLPVMMNIDIRG